MGQQTVTGATVRRKTRAVVAQVAARLTDPDPAARERAVASLLSAGTEIVPPLIDLLFSVRDFSERLDVLRVLLVVGHLSWWDSYAAALRLGDEKDATLRFGGRLLLKAIGPPSTSLVRSAL